MSIATTGSPPGLGAEGASPCTANGLLLIDKPEGPTSHDVVLSVRRALGAARVGHAGTLDPFASGLLVVAAGRATRLLRFLAVSDKTYEGEIHLGFSTDTDDRTGSPLHDPLPVDLPEGRLTQAVESLSGEFLQAPPLYSARKHEGVRSYRLARSGRPVPRTETGVRVAWQELRRVGPDRLRFRVSVSAGTYVRALARDLGERLGCGAHLVSLRRVAAGTFDVMQACRFPLDTVALRASLLPIEAIPLPMPTVVLDKESCTKVENGRSVEVPIDPAELPEAWVRLLDPNGRLVALAEHAPVEGSACPLLHARIVFPRS